MIDRSDHYGEGGWRSLFVRVLEKLNPDTLLGCPFGLLSVRSVSAYCPAGTSTAWPSTIALPSPIGARASHHTAGSPRF